MSWGRKSQNSASTLPRSLNLIPEDARHAVPDFLQKVRLLQDVVRSHEYLSLRRAEWPFDFALSLHLYQHEITGRIRRVVQDDERVLRVNKAGLLIADLCVALRFRQGYFVRAVGEDRISRPESVREVQWNTSPWGQERSLRQRVRWTTEEARPGAVYPWRTYVIRQRMFVESSCVSILV